MKHRNQAAPPPNLAAFAAERPGSHIGLIRSLWPTIAACLDAGHTIRAVQARLELDGIRIPYSTLCAGIASLRSGRFGPATTAAARLGERTGAEDPLRNIRRMAVNRPGFDYSGTLPDEELFGK